jgi:hypothetical protein
VALRVSEAMWNLNRILNLIVVIASPDITETANRDVEGTEGTGAVNIYTWFPYKGGHCADPVEVVLIAQCLSASNGQLNTNESLFPNKIPKNLQGCPIKVGAIIVDPYVILTENSTDTTGNAVYRFRGLEAEYLLLICEALNCTLEFKPVPRRRDLYEGAAFVLDMLKTGEFDVGIGRLILTPLVLLAADVTIIFNIDAVEWYDPCPIPMLRTEKIMGVFTPSVWLTMAAVIILTTLVFWRTSNGPASAVTESHTYRTVLNCAYNACAAFMGVSVPQMPRTTKLRVLFFVFVCYCFAMSIVFQAFFTSFLVATGLWRGD